MEGGAQQPSSTALATTPPQQQVEEQPAKCPRCESTNTKFCYYNNYNLSQPRHFCKSCRRYWTKGGALRNVPIGGGSRKNNSNSNSNSNSKRASPNSSSSTNPSKRPSTTITELEHADPIFQPPLHPEHHQMLDISGSFSSLLGSSSQLGSLMEFDDQPGDLGLSLESQQQSSADSSGNENFLSLQGDWASGWPDLAIYTPGNGFQ
ncbi:hypothetical protein J5N97_025729 [Dioscorea zingiberensis]|uniref:Dof zinc finger protein n=1 Tax=Dioscorea zingiberensis TaxID=325984 RepID=A0A9D5H5X2_9LILI|nr:hypothetical protein J5N97_025729 [Dioscorea zingiberensis]